MPEYTALVAIDWADQQHAVCLSDPSTGARKQAIVKHTPAALQEWAFDLRQRFGGAPIAICLEQSRGPLIYAPALPFSDEIERRPSRAARTVARC